MKASNTLYDEVVIQCVPKKPVPNMIEQKYGVPDLMNT